MFRYLTSAALLLAFGCPVARAQQAQPYVYRGAGCTGRDRMAPFTAMLGRAPVGVVDFAENSDWTHMRDSIGWGMWCWSATPYRLTQSVPMLMSTGTLADGARGAFDKEFVLLGKQMVAAGYGDSYLRIGWEMNGNWYRWFAGQDPVSFRAYYRRIVQAFRRVPGQHFRFIWNPGVGTLNFPPDQAYPGDPYVDVIGMDLYNTTWAPDGEVAASRWSYILTQPYGLNWLQTFARLHRKPIAFPEWGTGTRPDGHGAGDDALFIDNMAAWIANNNVVMQSYWDYNAGDYDAELSGGQFPLAEAAFTSDFALPVTAARPPMPKPAPRAHH